MKRKIIVAILAVAMIAGTLAAPLAQVFAAGTEKKCDRDMVRLFNGDTDYYGCHGKWHV